MLLGSILFSEAFGLFNALIAGSDGVWEVIADAFLRS